jgi:competence protein ComEC
MAKRKRPRNGDSGGLGLFALALVALCLLLTWAVVPQPYEGARPADPTSPEVLEPTSLDLGTASPPGAPLPTAMRVHFYDVSQGLAALVDLPGGRHLLVDAGDAPAREGCGADCATAHRHLLADLDQDLGGASIDLLWITHQHSDHIGGARDVLSRFHVVTYVDNGRDLAKAEVARTRQVALAHGTAVLTVDPTHPYDGTKISGVARITSVLPPAWPQDCATDPNECSLGLRLDFGASSVLFTGDAERGEERELPRGGKITLLQVGHHGSETSTTESFLASLAPRYAVISAGHPGIGMNAEYCLPRASTLERIGRVLEPTAGRTLLGYDGKTACRKSHGEGWVAVPVSDRLWATERDGDVVLTTRGDGVFAREAE